MRPMLRPGLKVLRRDPRTLQLGMDWPGVTALPDTAALRAVLGAIDAFRDVAGVVLAASNTGPSPEECTAVLGTLIDCGAVVDYTPRLAPELGESTEAALWLLAGPGRAVADVVGARERSRLWVCGTGSVADAVARLSRSAGLRLCRDAAAATVIVVASDREPTREIADALMHVGVPHLWAYVRDLVGVIGPFVVPGATACLRCVDAARASHDSAWPTLLQSAEASPQPVPPCDAVLATLVAAWAAQEVALWASDIRPQTYGRVIEVPQGWGPAETVQYEPHPACGCGWPLRHDTMGA
jgi:bacteriocin biosynthesis cyclodehydratase domain-containing protein